MRMEVEREVGAAASAAEASVAPEAVQKVADRLHELEVERQHWISRREEALAHQEKLLKLLQLQGPKTSESEPHKANNETESAKQEQDKTSKADVAARTRKKELKELQAQAEAAQKKQQAAATVLARNLKTLQAKRKREENQMDEQPRKKIDVGDKDPVQTTVAAPEMHLFATAPELDVGTPELAQATYFRIATRHFTQTGTMISREKLEQVFQTYTGKEVDDWASVERTLAKLIADDTAQTVSSSNSARMQPVCWQPGRQFLKTPTFVSSDAGRIQALIEVEKEVVVAVCDSLRVSDNRSTAFIRMRRQRQFLSTLLADGSTTPTLSAILSACVGVKSAKPNMDNNLRIFYRSHGQMAGVFDNMETWLCEQAETSEPHSTFSPRMGRLDGSRERFFSSKYAKAFSVSKDSVVRQLREAMPNPSVKKIDPMKVLCHYELNGVCNDKNCSNYHQKDFEPSVNELNNINDCTDQGDNAGGARVVELDEMDQLLVAFTGFRGRMMEKWPLITGTRTSSPSLMTRGTNNDETPVAAGVPSSSGVDPTVSLSQDAEGKTEESEEDFISLNAGEVLHETGDARYFDDINSKEVYGDMLQAQVEKDPSDTDAWLLFAIFQLELEVELSDEAINLSDNDRLLQQLVFLCQELHLKHHSGTSRSLATKEENLKRCLHTLSRALEVEENAYCEALWLLYLHLCRKVTNRQTEIDMVEQGVQFLPKSHALWLRYISTYDFDSVGMAEGIYWRLLEHLAGGNSAEDALNSSRPTPTKEKSILLTAISFHLCIKLWRAGATKRTLELLSALLQFGDTSSEFAWCSMVHRRLCGDELIVFCLAFAHVLVFKELPGLIEHWIAASSCARIPVKGLTYTAESLRHGKPDIEESEFARALASYEYAFKTFEKERDTMQDAGDAIVSNWILLLAYQGDSSKNDEPLKIFFEEKFDMIQQYPGASLTAAKVMGLQSADEQRAHQLMRLMLNRSSKTQFPEALHHYLFGCRQSPVLVGALDKTFPDVMERLARLLDVDIDKVEKSIQDIMHDTSNMSKTRALKALLEALLAAWMDQHALLRKQDQSVNQHTSVLADIYVALDICHLMGLLLEPSVAIDGIQLALSSSNFGALSLEARQLAWMQRFVFEVDLLQQKEADSFEHQTRLTLLFRKYMLEMSVEAEMVRQVSRWIKRGIASNAVADAVCDCLYPERSQLITYEVNLEIFRLCSAAIAGPEQASFFASFTDALALSSEFSLAFSDTATHEWELLAARASLRKCLGGTKTQRPKILQALVAVELRLRNMKAISTLLEYEMHANPLLLESWRLVVGLEILFGVKLDERSKKISEEMKRRQLVFACNTFGDDKVSRIENLDTASLSLRGLGLEYVPNAVLLKAELVSLNISGNELVELPMSLRHLKNLEELDASENALVEFPVCVNSLAQLKELRLAHNDMTTTPVPTLPHLSILDIRWNAVAHLPASAVAAATSLEVLQAEENRIPEDELLNISDLLSSREYVISSGPEVQARGRNHNLMQAEEKEEEVAREEPVSVNLSESAAAEQIEVTSAVSMTEATKSGETRNPSIIAEDVSTTSTINGDQIMEEKSVDAASKSKEDEGDEMMDVEMVDSSSSPKQDEDQIMGEENADAQSSSEESMVLVSVAKTDDSAAKTSVAKAVGHPQEIIDVDSSESPEEDQQESLTLEDQAVTSTSNTETAADTTGDTVVLPASNAVDPNTGNIVEAEDFAQNHSEVVAATAARQQSSHEVAAIARRKLAAYMEQNHIDNRAEVRRRSPALWREFFAASVPLSLELPACRMCSAPNDGHNQRFNSTVLCVRCLEEAVLMLKKRNEQVEVAEEIV